MIISVSAVKSVPITSAIQQVVGMSHCASDDGPSQCCDVNGDHTDDSCFGDVDCDCTCCVHIMMIASLHDFDLAKPSHQSSQFGYQWDYHKEHYHSTFHPPSLG